jgi:hypothetical protein
VGELTTTIRISGPRYLPLHATHPNTTVVSFIP